jgi:uncharacterized MnhB-related membrane protein
MTGETGSALNWGATVVAALLWFAALVALFRRDLGNPLVAAAVFALAGAVAWLAGRGALRRARRSRQAD